MFTIKTVLDFCKKNPNFSTGFIVVGHGSWRGSYDEPCIYIKTTYESGPDTLASTLVEALEKLISGDTFYGYKGGEYVYDGTSRLNIERSGSSYSGSNSMWEQYDVEVFKKAVEVFEYMQEKHISI